MKPNAGEQAASSATNTRMSEQEHADRASQARGGEAAGPGNANLSGNMGQAVKHLEKQVERGEHVAVIGGHKIHEHSGRHGNDEEGEKY